MPTSHRDSDPFQTWLRSVEAEARRLLRRSARPVCDHDDIVAEVVAGAWTQGSHLMERYPQPHVYAGVRTRHAAESFYRSARSQRGEGARLHRAADGSVAPGRTVVSADALVGGIEAVAGGDGFEDDVLEHLVHVQQVDRVMSACAGGVSADDLEAYLLVEAHGWSVADVARLHGVVRETMSRRVSAVREAVREAAGRALRPPV